MCIDTATLIRQTLETNPDMTCGRDTQIVLATMLETHGLSAAEANHAAMPYARQRAQQRQGARDCTQCIVLQATLAAQSALMQATA